MLNLVISAGDNSAIGTALAEFSGKTIDLLNVITGALIGLFAVAIAILLIYYAVKFGQKDVEMASEAKKDLKQCLYHC